MSWSQYSDELHEAATRRVLEEGLTLRAAATAVGASRSTISRWVRLWRAEHGFATEQRPPRHGADWQKHEAVRLVLEEGLTFAGAARKTGVTPPTVRKWTHEARPAPKRGDSSQRAQAEAMRLMAEEGLGPRQVARQLGLSVSVVAAWIRHGNVR
ncbi:MAG: helix-turn-helix domain-containing protein [Segniliparus sp.]|uniref:helix-turn-helix domain-containing protein n=1 Tax=Segniliparus sp. TaxID=2804064 RepID=UPI003F3D86EC